MLDEIKSILPSLKEKDLKELIILCNLYIAKKQKIPESDFYIVVSRFLNVATGIETQALPILKKQNLELFNKILETEASLKRLLKEKYPECTKQNRLLFYNLVCEVIYEKINKINVVCTLSTFINFFKEYQVYFDAAYPGYLNSGLLYFLIESRKV